MKKYFMIYFGGCLNGKRNVFIDLCVIELDLKDDKIHPMFQYHLMNYLYKKRGENKLGPKNGYQTSGWLNILKILEIPKGYESKTIKVNSLNVAEIHKIIENPLKKAITEKIKIEKKGVKRNDRND